MPANNFEIKNKLQIKGIHAAGPLISDSVGLIDSTASVSALYGGTGTTTAPTAGQVLYSSAGTTYAPTTLSSLIQGSSYQADAPSSPDIGDIWIESDSNTDTFDPNIIRRKSFTATAGQTVFTADIAFVDGYEQVYFNGLLLLKTTDYTTSNSITVTLVTAAAVNDIIEIITITNLSAYIASQSVSISSNTNLEVSKKYFVTSASALTLTLPASPVLSDEIDIQDASGNALTYNITVARNGKLINGNAGNLVIDVNGYWASLVYTGTTYGWKVK